MRRVLITGGAGFIGQATARLLMAMGVEVRVMDSLTEPVHQHGCPYQALESTQFQIGDVRNVVDWQAALDGVSHVLHLAAYQDYLPDFSRFFDVNATGTALLYETIVARQLPVEKVVIASSQAIYGEGCYDCHRCGEESSPAPRSQADLARGDWRARCGGCGEPVKHNLLVEEAGVNPASAYGLSKHAQEQIGQVLGTRYGIPTTSLRYSIVQGPGQSFANAYSGILRIFTQRLLQGKQPLCYEDGKQLRDYVAVQDVARANCLALGDLAADFECFNVGGGRANTVSVREYAEALIRRLAPGLSPEVPGRFRVGDTRHVVSAISKIEQRLGWRPEVGLDQIMDEYITWAVANGIDQADRTDHADQKMAAVGTTRGVNL